MTLQYQRAPRCHIPLTSLAVLNHAAPGAYQQAGSRVRRKYIMKIALLVLLGLMVGALGGAVLGIGAGLAWVQIFRTTGFEGYNNVLVFFTFMPLGGAIGGLGGALLFGVIGIRDAEIALEQEPARRRQR
jgi:hypothetical protein